MKSVKTTLNRIPARGHYDEETLFMVLDAGFICHVAFFQDGYPHLIPTAYGRKGRTIFLHGSVKSRMLRHLASGAPASVAVTHLDGIVLARSSFHSSMNYRSAVVYGTAEPIKDPGQKTDALKIISDAILPGRWEEARKPTPDELKATAVVAFHIEEGSAKIRSGPPADNAADEQLPVWAGVLPAYLAFGEGIPDPKLGTGIQSSRALEDFLADPKSHK